MRVVVDTFINSYGLFQDIWAPLVESILNLGCSIGLGYFYGLHGILGGVIFSQVIVIFIWKPYFLFSQGLKLSIPRRSSPSRTSLAVVYIIRVSTAPER